MQPLSSSCKWSSRDSLSSTPSFLFSESDQTEDETDVASSEGEGEAGGGKPRPRHFSLAGDGAVSPRPRSAYGGQRGPRGEDGYQAGRSPRLPGLPPSPPSGAPLLGDVAFTRKCAELQGYIRPLLELLNGLKVGKYDRGLSTFQQSVAMDRLQRIVGILQKPDMGEKYLRTLMQVEMMLKLWFPQVSPRRCSGTPPPRHLTPTVAQLPSRWHHDQLHIPPKKRRLNRFDTDSLSPAPPPCKRLRDGARRDTPHGRGEILATSRSPASPASLRREGAAFWRGEEKEGVTRERRIARGATVLPIACPRDALAAAQSGRLSPLVIPPPASRGRHTDMQDSAISSTTPTPTSTPPLPRCPERLVAAEIEDVGAVEFQGRSRREEEEQHKRATPSPNQRVAEHCST